MKRLPILLAAALPMIPCLTQLRAQIRTQVPTQTRTNPREVDPKAPTDPIVAQELSLWRAYGTRDFDAFKALLLPDYLVVEEHIRTRAEILAYLPTCTLDTFDLTDPQIRHPTPDAAAIVYRFSYSMTCNKTQLHIISNATTVWVRRNDRWLAQLHSEAPATAPPVP